MNDDEKVRQAIWDRVPELREPLIAFERETVAEEIDFGWDPYIGAYMFITDVLRPYLIPLLDDPDGDGGARRRCAEAIEEVLEARSRYLDDAVGIRVVSRLLREPERWRRFRGYAGPLLKEYVKGQAQYFIWPFDEPVV